MHYGVNNQAKAVLNFLDIMSEEKEIKLKTRK